MAYVEKLWAAMKSLWTGGARPCPARVDGLPIGVPSQRGQAPSTPERSRSSSDSKEMYGFFGGGLAGASFFFCLIDAMKSAPK